MQFQASIFHVRGDPTRVPAFGRQPAIGSQNDVKYYGVSTFVPITARGTAAFQYAHQQIKATPDLKCFVTNKLEDLPNIELHSDRIMRIHEPFALHVVVSPTVEVDLQYLQDIALCKEGNWLPCKLRASAEEVELPNWEGDFVTEAVCLLELVKQKSQNVEEVFLAAVYQYMVTTEQIDEDDPMEIAKLGNDGQFAQLLVAGFKLWEASGGKATMIRSQNIRELAHCAQLFAD